ncbi:MAG: hypothetical protein H6709_15870 [Kofleriaceae bacterium]|nr:hypothetical protein [Myxococcales bacterium]MCB9573557.1 hypothetical protein [Kofleriaceae bacterium]
MSTSSLRRLAPAALALPLAVVAAACGNTTTTTGTPLNLDRPVDIAFGCYGGLRLVGDNGTADASDPVVESAQPLEGCAQRALPTPGRPPGQEDLTGESPIPTVGYYAFILESVPGTVAVASFPAKDVSEFLGIEVNVADADPLTPGKNAIAVGDLPVAIASDRAGCHMVTANAGSCDLSVIDIGSVVDDDTSTKPDVRAIAVTNAAGDEVLARPAAMVAEPPSTDVGAACPDTAEGLVYVAYPQCHRVAAIRAGTGEIEASIHFAEDGTVEITDGDFTCPAECGGGGAPVAGERPVTLDLVEDKRVGTRRLAIGADDSPFLTVVELGADSLPQSFSRVELEGDVGVIDVALSPQIGMGGSSGSINDDIATGGQFQFVYAVATDGTVRVADVLSLGAECDTQVDPRYIRGLTNVRQLSCFPVGDAATPPRRAGAKGPGIELVAAGSPLSVAITWVDTNTEQPGPDTLVGYFAVVTSTSGQTTIVNIDDDNYEDLWHADDPLGNQPALAVPHQIRDNVKDRDALAIANNADEVAVPICSAVGPSDGGGPRLSSSVERNDTVADTGRIYMKPGVRRLACHDEIEDTDTSVYEIDFSAPQDVRDQTFPDLRAMRFSETWTMIWEGTLSRDDFSQSIDGPAERVGVVQVGGGQMHLDDPSRPFCAAGVEPYDFAVLTGCDPSNGDADCGLGMTCYVHPDATVAAGQCLPIDTADSLSGTCRSFLVSERRYAITETDAGTLTLVPRRHVLPTTPLSGCVSDQQCADLAAYDALLDTGMHPSDFTPPDDLGDWRCMADPSRTAGIDRCVETCAEDADCDDGTVCQSGVCVEGVVPPAACVPGVNRYTLHAGEAFAVLGDSTGFLHPIVEDPATGACVKDPDASPLMVGRLPLVAPPCTGDGYTDLTPNPCSTTVTQTERVPQYKADSCDRVDASGNLITRDAQAIRFQNPAFRLNIVDPTYPGDARCREDREGTLVDVPTVKSNYSLTIPLVAGFLSERAAIAPVFPVRVVRGPENSVWVIDEGDNIPQQVGGTNTRGQVFRFEPGYLGKINVVQ